ncbi:hypothetical protein ACFL5B_02430 [Candidatus Latescibacterota bacterium]
MSKSFIISSVLLLFAFLSSTLSEANNARIIENYGKIPLSFTTNQGQYDPQVKFTTHGSGSMMFFTRYEITFLLLYREV